MWVGHSFGGRLAAELAARDPGRVERLVLLDPALQVLPHVALDLAELERADVSYASVEDAVQARYDSGRLLLASRELVIESDAAHLDPGTDGRLRYRYCKSAVIAAWSIMASPPPPPAGVPTLIVLGAESWLTSTSTSRRTGPRSAIWSRSSPSRADTPCTGTRSTRRARPSRRFSPRGGARAPIRAAADGAPGTHGDDGPTRTGKDGRCPQPPGGDEFS